VLGDMRPDAVGVFLGSLVSASFLSLVPLAILWCRPPKGKLRPSNPRRRLR
jgi:hypothetical protein